ncbi:MAG: type I restriction enzyme HsdR N-terminal domain-containing protein [Bacteroidales bacterium]|nr:type I restriction enzyme HsdR N-terminal domain-containing protein [Bacteroidales bacterium]
MSQFSVRKSNGKTEIFDIVRKKYVSLTPEEWVRQNVLHYLAETKRYPLELMQVEGSITFNSMPKRCDIIVYDKLLKPLLLVECKKPAVALSQKTFDQAMIYNMVLEVPYILITNGLQHCCFSLDKSAGKLVFHDSVPQWQA